MIALQVVDEDCKKADVVILDLPRFGKHLEEIPDDIRGGPVELAYKLQDFVDRLLGEYVVDEVSDEELQG